MSKLPRISGEKAIQVFERMGFTQVRQRGSHVVLKKQTPTGAIGCCIPLHPDEFLKNL